MIDAKVLLISQLSELCEAVPRGASRALKRASAKFNYISMHKRRAGLQVASRLL